MAIKNKFKFIRFIVIAALIFYFIYYLFISFFVKQDKTFIAKYDLMYLENEYHGLIIRNEKTFFSDINGKIEYKINDGEVVKKGQVIAEIESLSDVKSNTDDIKLDTNFENKKPEILKELDEEIYEIKLKIVNAVNGNEIEEISNLEEKLKLKLDLKDKLTNNKIKNFNLEEISNRNGSDESSNYFYSNYSGIVSKKFDGLEKILTMSNLYLLDYNKIYNENIDSISKNSGLIQKNENVYRIIDNYSYYIAYIIPFEDIRLFNNNLNNVKVEIEGIMYSASVYDCFENNTDGILVLELNQTFDQFYLNRKVENKIVSDKFKGLKINNDAIIINDGIKGVYKIGVGFDIEFVPVKVLSSSDKFSIVEENYFYVYENDNRKKVMTINVNDEIIKIGNEYMKQNDL
ncbi:HlyD family efflux transporter periplasmic adaptor subunit [Clostridiaceae bacterium HSG29]|nr:HlyD family efflux transporter periplasmic adaptor subunit [Clostridiaceae bacterium HSG29]